MMAMILGTDSAGNVLLVSDAADVSAMPKTWNGIAITAYQLTPEQVTAYSSLPSNRAGAVFDGRVFTAITAIPVPPLDISDIDNLDKTLKALALLTRQYANALKAGTYVAKTVADTRSDFMTIYRALP